MSFPMYTVAAGRLLEMAQIAPHEELKALPWLRRVFRIIRAATNSEESKGNIEDGRRLALRRGYTMAPAEVLVQELRPVALLEMSAVSHNKPGQY